MLKSDRIDHLIEPGLLAECAVTVIGLGSGGAPVCDHLAMAGVGKWCLFDPDTLDELNLVKHPRQRRDLGRRKVDIQKEWILDRNPAAQVAAFAEDIADSEHFPDAVAQSDLVLCCVDNVAAREIVNDACVRASVPFVTAMVFRTGFGGEVFAYRPGETGCYRCLDFYAQKAGMNLSDVHVPMNAADEDRVYGLGQAELAGSGLSLDIQQISILQARHALSILTLSRGGRILAPLKANWTIFANRPYRGAFTSHFESENRLLRSQEECFVCKQIHAAKLGVPDV